MDLKNKEISWQKVGRRLLSNVKKLFHGSRKWASVQNSDGLTVFRALGPYSNYPNTLHFILGTDEGLPTKITPHVRQPLIKL